MNLSELLNVEKDQIINTGRDIERPNTQKDKDLVSVGANNFDLILGGGFQKGETYIIFGGPHTGKTQLCHQICIQTYKILSKTNKDPLKKFIIYFDTESTFRPERIKEMSKFSNVPYEILLKQIMVSNILSNSALLRALNEMEDILDKNPINILMIDSINNHYRSEKISKDLSLSRTKNDFLAILRRIRNLTLKYELITLLTAQISPNFIEPSIISELPVGIQYINHFFSEEIYLQYKEENKCYAHLVNSHSLPERKLLYKITKKGLRDFKL